MGRNKRCFDGDRGRHSFSPARRRLEGRAFRHVFRLDDCGRLRISAVADGPALGPRTVGADSRLDGGNRGGAAGRRANRMVTTASLAARAHVSCILAALSCGIGTLARAQTNSIMLPTYRGWGIGISLDSANKLAVRGTKEGLICVGEETREMFCKSDEAVPNVMTVNAYFTPSPRRLDEVILIQLRDRPMASDSIFAPFIRGWGKVSRHDDTTVSSTSPTGKHSARRQKSAEWKFPG